MDGNALELVATGFEADVYRMADAGGETRAVRVYADLAANERCAREMAALGGLHAAGYPSPALFCGAPDGGALGRPYLVIEWLPGGSLESAFWSAAPTDRPSVDATLYRALGRLHTVDPVGVVAQGPVPLAHEVGELETLSARLGEATPAICRDALAWLTSHVSRIAPVPAAIVHGDFHRNNVLARADGSWCVIDWSNVRCGDPRVDLGWTGWILALIARVSGLPPTDPPLAAYRAASDRETPDLAWFEVLAVTRFLLSDEITRRFGAASQGLHPAADDRLDRTGVMTAFAHQTLRPRIEG